MTEGWGTDWLPPHIQRRVAQDDAREALESKRAEAEREVRAEERHQRAMELHKEQAELRGEVIDVLAMARGEVPGRTVEDILASARAAMARDDVITAAKLHRDGNGDPAPVHVEVAEPRLLTGSPVRRSIASRSRRWQAWQEKKKAAADARKAVEASLDNGLIKGVTPRSRPTAALTARSGPAPDDGLRFR